MRRRTVTIILALAILVLLVLAGRFGFTVVTIEDVEQTVQDEAFDPVAYVDGIWESRVLPTFNEEVVELSKVLNEMEPDVNGKAAKENLIDVANQYGLITDG